MPSAHGEEIVRSIYVDDLVRTIWNLVKYRMLNFLESDIVYTTGEDGFVRAWGRHSKVEEPVAENSMPKQSKAKKEGRLKEGRYKPY
jgi:hypothetical protein